MKPFPFDKILFSVVIIILGSCARKEITPKTLGEDVCKCYNKLHDIKNETAKLKRVQECGQLQTIKQLTLQNLGVKQDWSNSQVEQAEIIYRNVINNCN